MITARIRIPRNPELLALLKSERFAHPRASYSVSGRGGVVITVEARDATALKTVVSSIARVIAVYEKACRAVESGVKNG